MINLKLKTRIKWVRAQDRVAKHKNENIIRRLKGMWTAFWLAPALAEQSSVEHFLSVYDLNGGADE